MRGIMNNQAINVGRQQVIGRSGMLTFEARKNDIMAHVHDHYNILCAGAWFFCLCMDYLIFSSFFQIICLDSLQMWWKEVPICFYILFILHLQSNISDDIGLFPSLSTAPS